TSYGGTNNTGTVFKLTASGISTLVHFNTSNGSLPLATLIQGADGDLYGTTAYGGVNGYGTAFRVTTGGALTTLASFDMSNGAYPDAGLAQDAKGDLYGTTPSGGNGAGTVFRLVGSAPRFTNIVKLAGGIIQLEGDHG